MLGQREFWRTQLGVLVLVSFGFFVAFAAMESTFALYTEAAFAWTANENGKFFSLIGAVIVLVQGLVVGRMVASFGERRTLIIGPVLAELRLRRGGAVDRRLDDAAGRGVHRRW